MITFSFFYNLLISLKLYIARLSKETVNPFGQALRSVYWAIYLLCFSIETSIQTPPSSCTYLDWFIASLPLSWHPAISLPFLFSILCLCFVLSMYSFYYLLPHFAGAFLPVVSWERCMGEQFSENLLALPHAWLIVWLGYII